MEKDFRKIFSRLRLAAATLLAALPVILVIRQMRAVFQASQTVMLPYGHMLEMVIWAFFLLAALYIFGLFCAWQYTGAIAESLVDFWLYPRRYLKKRPPVLSRQQGLIAACRYEEAKFELLEMRQNYADSPEITLMLADLRAEKFNDLESAVVDCRYYFKNRSWRYHELNLPIVLRYADWQCTLGNCADAVKRLSKEVKSSIYPPQEKKALQTRLESLQNTQQ